eukprot:11918392-Alexandrium_andersonii.AAC.1
MSASLVGSEMCIRDRRSRRLRAKLHGAHRPANGVPILRPLLGPRASSPVSYTHLTLPTICSV